MNSPVEYFFKLGDKITKNDPIRKADWDFYLMLIMFLAFLSIGIGNLIQFFKEQRLYYLGWTGVMMAILWFQYFGLKQMYEFRKMLKSNKPNDLDKIKNQEEMLKSFNKEDLKKGEKKQ